MSMTLDELESDYASVVAEYQGKRATLRAKVNLEVAAGLRLAREAIQKAKHRRAAYMLRVSIDDARSNLQRCRTVMAENKTVAELHNAKAVRA